MSPARSVRVLALILAHAYGCKGLVLYVDDGGADGSACATSTTCTACAPRSGCGWCNTAQRCVGGTMSGPSDRSCGGADWVWLVESCSSAPRDASTGDASVSDASEDP